MKHEIVLLGKTRESFIAAGIADYADRIKHYAKLSLIVLKERKLQGSDAAVVLESEGQQLLQSVAPGALIVALDVAGQPVSSEELAEYLEKWEQEGVKTVSFLIGGHLGIARSVVQKANLCISLSRMTFTHELARLLLLEQIYRAHTIKAGEKYHK